MNLMRLFEVASRIRWACLSFAIVQLEKEQ
jgi:hypothetical protein